MAMLTESAVGDGADPPGPFDLLAPSEEPLVEMLDRLGREGVGGSVVPEPDAIPPGVRCRRCGRRHLPERVRALEAHRFEDPSSPGEETILIVVQCPRCGARGAVVSASGPTLTPAEAEVLAGLGAAYGRSFPVTRPPRDDGPWWSGAL